VDAYSTDVGASDLYFSGMNPGADLDVKCSD